MPILRLAIPSPLRNEFDYLPPQKGSEPFLGRRVLVPFGRRQQVGVVIGRAGRSDVPMDKLKRCTAVLDDSALLSSADLWLIRFTSDYYHHPIGEVVAAALPALLRQGKALHAVRRKISATAHGLAADMDVLEKRAPRQAALLSLVRDADTIGRCARK